MNNMSIPPYVAYLYVTDITKTIFVWPEMVASEKNGTNN